MKTLQEPKNTKKSRTILVVLFALILAIPFAFYFSIQSNYVQNFLIQKSAGFLAKELKTKVSIKKIDLELIKTLVLEEVYIQDLSKDTLLYVGELKVDISDYILNENQFHFNILELNNVVFHLHQKKGLEELNLDFILNYFASTNSDTSSNSPPLNISIDNLALNNVDFAYKDENVEETHFGIHYSDIRTRLSLSATNVNMHADTISAQLNNLKLSEKSGFGIASLKGNIIVSPIITQIDNIHLVTDNSRMSGDVEFNYSGYSDYKDFNNKIHINSSISDGAFNMKDIAYFAPQLEGINQKIMVNSHVVGNVNNMKISELELNYGSSTNISGDFVLTDITDPKNAFFLSNNLVLNTNADDLGIIQVPPFTKNEFLTIPEVIHQLKNIQLNGSFKGFLHDFKLNAQAQTGIGGITGNLTYYQDPVSTVQRINGGVMANQFNLGRLFGNEETLGKTSFKLNVEASGGTIQDMKARIDGKVNKLQLLDYDYEEIPIEGELTKGMFNGYMLVEDTNLNLRFDGLIDITEDVPFFEFVAAINNAKLNKLHLVHDTLNYELSTYITSSFKGVTIDELEGNFGVFQTEFLVDSEKHEIESFEIRAKKDSTHKVMNIISDIVEGTIEGDFNSPDILKSIVYLVEKSVPSYFTDKPDTPENVNYHFDLSLSNLDLITKLFLPDLEISNAVSLTGNYDSFDQNLAFKLKADSLLYGDFKLGDIELDGRAENSVIQLDLFIGNSSIADSLELDNFHLYSKSINDLVQFETTWDNLDSSQTYGNIGGILSIVNPSKLRCTFLDTYFSIDGNRWNMEESNELLIDSTKILLTRCNFHNNEQHISISGGLSENSDQKAQVVLKNMKIESFDKLLIGYGIDLRGKINGEIEVSDFYSEMLISSSFDLENIVFNNDSLGHGKLNAVWDKEEKRININGQLGTEFNLVGNYYPYKENQLDAYLLLNSVKIKKFEPFLDGVLSDLKGHISGKLNVSGKLIEPALQGELNLNNAALKVDYLNTNYVFENEKIVIEKDWFGLDNVMITDRYGNKAQVTGTVVHNNFSDINFDVAVFPNHFECLNTTSKDNPTYYGHAFATGNLNVSGYADQLVLDIKVKTEKGTEFFIPLSDDTEFAQNDFIQFVVKDSSLLVKQEEYKVNLDGIQMNFDLDITSDAKLQIIFDEQVGDVIKAQGNGNVKMEINTLGDFNIYGAYEIFQGEYMFTLENIINKKFEVASGSSISWDGDPYNARINIDAIYKLKASLKDLAIPGVDTSGKRIPVNCHLLLTESLEKPELAFDVNVPGVSANVNTTIKSNIISNEAMNKEVFSLLLINRFVPVSDNRGISAGSIGKNNSTELLSNQLSNWLSQISDDFDLGVNYTPGDEVSSSEMEVALSTQLFNDRVEVATNLGVQGDNPNTGKSNNIAGDFLVEYKISKDGKVRAKFYNESNDVNDLNTNNIPYTQGVGLFYTEEFNTFRDFMNKVFRKNN